MPPGAPGATTTPSLSSTAPTGRSTASSAGRGPIATAVIGASDSCPVTTMRDRRSASAARSDSSRTSSTSTRSRSRRWSGFLDDLKTERAQAAVDERRSLAEFADALGADAFDAAKAAGAGERRVQSADRLRAAVIRSLQEIHAILTAEQRERLSYMIRAGILTV